MNQSIEEQLLAPYLSAEEIQLRIDVFNENYDWSVFDDVPPIQHIQIMYPHKIDLNKILQLIAT